MAQKAYQSSFSKPRIDNSSVTILQSEWHHQITDLIVRYATEILEKHGARVTLISVPGCMELPITAQWIARQSEKPDAIIAIGIILKGDTDHYVTVRDGAISGLVRVMLDESIPILNEILPVFDIAQAHARASADEHNKGIEAAHACIDIINLKRSLDSKAST
jgi:6,7-dimethyl-8-ribityllumazine synthase